MPQKTPSKTPTRVPTTKTNPFQQAMMAKAQNFSKASMMKGKARSKGK